MRYLPLVVLLAACADVPSVDPSIDGVAIQDRTCGTPGLGCTVLPTDDGTVVLPVPAKPYPEIAIYLHSARPELGDTTEWRINGVEVPVTKVSRDGDGSDVTLLAPAALLDGDIEIASDRCDDPLALTVYRSIAGPNSTIPNGCTCNAVMHKIYCQVWGRTYTYCSQCCGY